MTFIELYSQWMIVKQLVKQLVCFRMLQPGDGEKNIHNIVMTFTPQLAGTVVVSCSMINQSYSIQFIQVLSSLVICKMINIMNAMGFYSSLIKWHWHCVEVN